MKEGLAVDEMIIQEMADSLVEIDPNMQSAEEGIAFVKRMQEQDSHVQPVNHKPILPETDEICIEKVAGKVVLIEDLQAQLNKVVT